MAVPEIFVLLGRKNKEGMQRYFIEMAYDGSRYNGWQIQPDAPSVQEAVERALSLTLRENIRVTGAGRTDTGVHASFIAPTSGRGHVRQAYSWVKGSFALSR